MIFYFVSLTKKEYGSEGIFFICQYLMNDLKQFAETLFYLKFYNK